MEHEELEDELFYLVGFLITSAHGLYQEPPAYGPFRLLDAAGRLLHIMGHFGMQDPFLQEVQSVVDGERFGSIDDGRLKQTLDRLSLSLAEELKRRRGDNE